MAYSDAKMKGRSRAMSKKEKKKQIESMTPSELLSFREWLNSAPHFTRAVFPDIIEIRSEVNERFESQPSMSIRSPAPSNVNEVMDWWDKHPEAIDGFLDAYSESAKSYVTELKAVGNYTYTEVQAINALKRDKSLRDSFLDAYAESGLSFIREVYY